MHKVSPKAIKSKFHLRISEGVMPTVIIESVLTETIMSAIFRIKGQGPTLINYLRLFGILLRVALCCA